MIKTLWFLIKMAVIIGGALWIAERPGTVEIDWQDYTFTIHLGLFLLGVLCVIYAFIGVRAVVQAIVRTPESYKKHQQERRRKNGYDAIASGLNAMALEDLSGAQKALERAEKNLIRHKSHEVKDESPIVLLRFLQAQIAQSAGDFDTAQHYFTALSKTKDGQFLGLRGLLNHNLRDHNTAQVEILLEEALKNQPRQKWVIQTAYQFYTAQKQWGKAQAILKRGKRCRVYDPGFVQNHMAAIFLGQANDLNATEKESQRLKYLKSSFKSDPGFVPTSLALAQFYYDQNQRQRAIRVVQRAWQNAAHPDLAVLWMRLIEPKHQDRPEKRLAWIEKLVVLNPACADGHIAAGHVAMEQALWGVARRYFERALSIQPHRLIYNLLADLERRSTGNQGAIDTYREKAAHAPERPQWVCQKTERVYEYWQPFNTPDSDFNTIIWAIPTRHTDDTSVPDIVQISQK